jgi:antitoxin MazE
MCPPASQGPTIILADWAAGKYGNYAMKTIQLNVTRIGNSRGIRLPAEVLRRYRVGDILLMEQRPDEIVLRSKPARNEKLSWAETYRQMAEAEEDWDDWEAAAERLGHLPGEGAL